MDMELSALNGGGVLTACAGQEVTFLDAASLAPIKAHRTPMHFREEGGASLHPQGGRFIAGGSDLWVRVFDFATGQELECHKGHHGPVRAHFFKSAYACGVALEVIGVVGSPFNVVSI